MRTLPLDGIRVLDLSSVVVGPVCSLRLAQYGAEVVKLEAPGGDNEVREFRAVRDQIPPVRDHFCRDRDRFSHLGDHF